jgi:alkanesulfonate monooxygenase SsuD/methylene tetrahydromethanopterin reductase-like flavin-dependent oxidoreductase (luciferase family)
MSRPLVGCILNRLGGADAARWRQAIEHAEAADLDHLAVGDHVAFHTGAGSDGLLAAATVLGVSDRLSTNTAVYLLPLRHPLLVARQLADISVRAPGRFTFGVGIGGEDRHEVESSGVDPATRGRRMDECIQAVRQLLTGQPVDFEGEFVNLTQTQITPPVVTTIPIVVGGRSDAAIRRAGKYGDGWFGIWVSADRYERSIIQMKESANDASRHDVEWTNALNIWCGVDKSSDAARPHVASAMETFYGMPYERFEKWSPAGPASGLAEFLMPYVAAGCSMFNLIINGPSVEAEIEAAAEIRRHLLNACSYNGLAP